jgi:peptidoglycan/xylan/chitin deacetylase (PgdA/CDA1 family)
VNPRPLEAIASTPQTVGASDLAADVRAGLAKRGQKTLPSKYLYDEVGSGVFVLTMHPQCIGRGSRMRMLRRLIEHMQSRDGVVFRTMADHYAYQQHPRHIQFVDENRPTWKKVRVFDSEVS